MDLTAKARKREGEILIENKGFEKPSKQALGTLSVG